MSDNDIVILSAVRTAQGRFMGGFAKTPAIDLGALVMKEALDRAGVTGEQLDEVIFGNVIQAGLGQNSARQAEIKAGIPVEVPAITVNRVCVSSAAAMAMAANAIKAGDGDIFLVGGMENMTRAPWVLQERPQRLPHGHAHATRCTTRWCGTASGTPSATTTWA